MENASKALLIAGGILISLLVLAIMVYVFASYRGNVISYQQTVATTEIQKYNENFLKFQGREDITIQEIISLVNYAPQYYKQTGVDVSIQVDKINYNGSSKINIDLNDDDGTLDFIKVIQDNSTEGSSGNIKHFKFDSNSITYDDSGLITHVEFCVI